MIIAEWFPCHYLHSQAFGCIFNPLSIWGGEVVEWFGGHQASSQGQFMIHIEPQRPERKSGARRLHPWLETIRSPNTQRLWQDSLIRTEGPVWYERETTLNRVWKIMAIGRGAWELEESKCQSFLVNGQEGGPRELQACQPQHAPCKGNGTANPGNHYQAREWQEGDRE